MTELGMINAGGSKWLRYVLTIAFVSILVVTIIMNALAGSASSPFENNTGDISHRHHTCITPESFTFAIWSVIYIWLILNAIYSVAILFIKIGFERAWQNGGAVSNLFLTFISINLCLNVAWLFAWDAEQMIAAAVLLILIMVTNTTALSVALYSFMKTGPTLWEISKKHFWCNVLFLNGQTVYDTWTTIAAVLNVAIMIQDVSDLNMETVCIGCLGFLLVGFIIYFILEQSLLAEFGNPVLTHYIVYIWAMIGAYFEHKDSASEAVFGMLIANLATGCVMLVARIGFLIYKNLSCDVYKKKE